MCLKRYSYPDDYAICTAIYSIHKNEQNSANNQGWLLQNYVLAFIKGETYVRRRINKPLQHPCRNFLLDDTSHPCAKLRSNRVGRLIYIHKNKTSINCQQKEINAEQKSEWRIIRATPFYTLSKRRVYFLYMNAHSQYWLYPDLQTHRGLAC